MNRHIPLLAVALLPGCELFNGANDLFKGLTNPLVTQGVVLGVDTSGAGDIDLSGVDVDEGVAVQVFLADAASASEIENAPIEGAEVSIRGQNVDDVGGGAYTMEPGALTYSAGQSWDLVVKIGDSTAKATVELPEGADYDLADTHGKGQPLTVNLTGQGFNSILVLVVDGESGDVTWSNEPETAGEVYDMTHGSDTTDTVQIPGSAFPKEGAYAIGVAGMLNTQASDLDNMNTVLSAAMSGQMVFDAVVVLP